MEKKIGMSVQYDCTGMMESEQQDFEVKFKEETEFEGGMSSDFFMNYMRKGIEDLIKRFPSHYKAVNNCFKHYEEEKKLDTVNMGNQMISFRGIEISMDDIMLMYDEFKAMMGKVSKKFLEPIKLDKTLDINIDESHRDDYVGAMSFVSKMLKAKGEDEPIRMLFQSWLVAKTDFVALLKNIIFSSNMKEEFKTNLKLCYIVMPFDGISPMFRYDKDTKQIYKLLNGETEIYKKEVSLNNKIGSSVIDKDAIIKKSEEIIANYTGIDIDIVKQKIEFYKNACKNNIPVCDYELIWEYRILDLGEDLYKYIKGEVAA